MIVDAPLTPPELAVIDAVPAATAVTTPVAETVATPAFEDPHVNAAAALGGDPLAVSWTVSPTASVALDGDTWIDFKLGPPLANDGAVGVDGASGAVR